MNQNQVIGIVVGVVSLVALAIAGSMWAMSPGSDVVVRPEKPLAALDAADQAEMPAARARAGRGGGAGAAAAGGGARAKLQGMDAEKRAELKAKIQAKRTNKAAAGASAGAGQRAAAAKGRGAAAGGKRRAAGGAGGAGMEGVNAKLDTYAKEAGWDTNTTEEVRSLLEETHQHMTETITAAKSGGGDRTSTKAELTTYRDEQSELIKAAVGADEFDGFVSSMGMQRFFSGAAGE